MNLYYDVKDYKYDLKAADARIKAELAYKLSDHSGKEYFTGNSQFSRPQGPYSNAYGVNGVDSGVFHPDLGVFMEAPKSYADAEALVDMLNAGVEAYKERRLGNGEPRDKYSLL